MKKINSLIILLFFTISLNSCAGYKPIFSSPFQFKIADYSIEGEKRLGNQIYLKLYNLSKSAKKTPELKNIDILINVAKDKNATAKNSAGKILAYKINLFTNVIIKDFITDKEILNENFVFSSSYKVQDQHSETINLENRSIENLINETYQDLLIKFSENIL